MHEYFPLCFCFFCRGYPVLLVRERCIADTWGHWGEATSPILQPCPTTKTHTWVPHTRHTLMKRMMLDGRDDREGSEYWQIIEIFCFREYSATGVGEEAYLRFGGKRHGWICHQTAVDFQFCLDCFHGNRYCSEPEPEDWMKTMILKTPSTTTALLPYRPQYRHRDWRVFLITLSHDWKTQKDAIYQMGSRRHKLWFCQRTVSTVPQR